MTLQKGGDLSYGELDTELKEKMTPPAQLIAKHERENLENEWLKFLQNKKAKSQRAIVGDIGSMYPFTSARQRKAIRNGD